MVKSVLVAVAVVLGAAQAPATPPYETLFYQHDGLRLEAYLFVPDGPGPFPMVVYNHGSVPAGREREEWAAPFLARLVVPAGYALLVPERRGYGKSEGNTFAQEIGQDRGPRFVARLRAEADDVNAAVDFVARTKSKIDAKHVVNMGYSFGGIVTTLASAKSASRYAAVMLQAPGALNWLRSADLRGALIDAAAKIRTPIMCVVAENDATTESAQTICAAAKAAGASATLKIYPPFNSGQERAGNAPGHALFAPVGLAIWRDDALAFLTSATR